MALRLLRLPSFGCAFSVVMVGYGVAMELAHVGAAEVQSRVGEVAVTVLLGLACFVGAVLGKGVPLTGAHLFLVAMHVPYSLPHSRLSLSNRQIWPTSCLLRCGGCSHVAPFSR